MAHGSASAAAPKYAPVQPGRERRLDNDKKMEVVDTHGRVVLMDNSNAWIQGKKAYAAARGWRGEDPTWRVHVGEIIKVVIKGGKSALKAEKIAFMAVFGSEPSPTDSVWEFFKKHDVHVYMSMRSKYTGKEKRVDNKIVDFLAHERGCFQMLVKLGQCRLEDLGSRRSYSIVGGDGDYFDSIEQALLLGIKVQLWTWREAKNNLYDGLEDRFPDFEIKYLDHPEVMKQIGFLEVLTKERMVGLLQDRKERTLVFTVVKGLDIDKLGEMVGKFSSSLDAYNFMFPNSANNLFFLVMYFPMGHQEFDDILTKASHYMKDNGYEDSVKAFVQFKSGTKAVDPDVGWAAHRWFAAEEPEEEEGEGGDDAREGEFKKVARRSRNVRPVLKKSGTPAANLPTTPCCLHEFCNFGIRPDKPCKYRHTAEELTFFQKYNGKSCFQLNYNKTRTGVRCNDKTHHQASSFYDKRCPYLHGDQKGLCFECLGIGSCQCPLKHPRKLLEPGDSKHRSLREYKYLY